MKAGMTKTRFLQREICGEVFVHGELSKGGAGRGVVLAAGGAGVCSPRWSGGTRILAFSHLRTAILKPNLDKKREELRHYATKCKDNVPESFAPRLR